jgi:GNAT superfamily N-acetyltransferase
VEIRRIPGLDESARVQTELHNACHPDDPVLPQDLHGWLESLDERESFVAEEGGEVVGGAWIATERGRPTPEARVLVPRPHRKRGVGTALFAAVSGWARERGHTHVEARVRETEPEALRFAEQRGFEEIGRERGLELDLRLIEVPAFGAPPGIEIATWAERPDAIRGIYEVACEAYPDVPGEEENRMASFDEWLKADMGGSGDRPEATFVALADGEVVGYAKFSLTDAQPTVAYHDMTGVRRAWRGRGVAGALKAAEIRWAKERGYERLRTQNEERNTPIRRLNERFGYLPAPGRLLMRGPIAPG